MAFTFEPIHPYLGAEIKGCDFSRALNDEALREILQGFYKYQVLVARDQRLTAPQQVAVLRALGTPKISQRKEFHVPGSPEIGRVGNTKNPDGTPSAFLDRHGDLWHSDTASDIKPDGVTMLYCVSTPEVGGDTCFVSLTHAYQTLPPALKAKIEGRQVTHNFNQHNDYLLAKNPGAAKPLSPEDRAKWQDRIHDLVQTHPHTGLLHYFITPTLMKSISGYSDDEAKQLTQELLEHATQPPAIFRHKWQVGDLVFWDNRATLHSATPANYAGGERLMHRGYSYL